MAIVEMDKHSSYSSRRRADRREYWLIYGIVFVPFLIVAIASRVLPGGRTVAGNAARRSIFAEARAAAASCIPFAFR